MSTKTNKAIVRRHIEQVWNEFRLDLYDELFAENVVHHGPGPDAPGLEGMKDGRAAMQKAFPDIQFAINDEIAEGDRVVLRATMTGTHQGELMGIPATGKRITQPGAMIYRLDNAIIVEVWFYFDELSLMRQLGVVPAPEAA
jgi:steroid delta-isomerase-like uncharacterized protein